MARGQSAHNKRLKDEVALLALSYRTPTAILNKLVDDAERLGIDSVPDERTIRRWLKEIRSSDTSGPWAPMAAEASQAARVLPVLAEVVTTGEEMQWLSQDLATIIDRVVLLAPSVPPRWAWALARAYQWARANTTTTQPLDLTLVLQPWQGVQAAITWARRLHQLGDQVGGWPGGGPGLVALAATLPPPGWAEGDRYWGAQLWQMLTEEIDTLASNGSQPADSNLTAKPLDYSGRTEMQAGENPHDNEDTERK